MAKQQTLVDKYISGFPKDTQVVLQQMRTLIRNAAVDATETMSYGIPTFVLNGNLVHFAGYKNHIGFYPGPSGVEHFAKEIKAYKNSKGAIQFPLNEPLPEKLITKIVTYRVTQNILKLATKSKVRTCKNGHPFTKTSDCPTCPICEKERKPKAGFMSVLGAPAIRALAGAKIKTLKQLSKKTEKELLALHGFGPSSIAKLNPLLEQEGLSFKK
jgi:uncharacterized protein YdhG (YjbR/CyaY superfamily)